VEDAADMALSEFTLRVSATPTTQAVRPGSIRIWGRTPLNPCAVGLGASSAARRLWRHHRL